MKRNKSRINRNKKVKAVREPSISISPIHLSKFERFKRFLKTKTGIVINSLLAIMAVWGFLYIPPIKNLWQSKHEQFVEANYAQGDLKAPIFTGDTHAPYSISEMKPNFRIPDLRIESPSIKGIKIPDFNKNGYVIVFISGYIFTCLRTDLEKGIDIFNPILSNCSSSHLILGIKDERLYVSVEFKDLRKEETIGFIEFNHWRLFLPNLLDFNNDDERLEVKDKQNNIVFSIAYETKAVFISGYLIGTKSIIVMPNDPKKSKSINPLCVLKTDTNWKQKALDEITLIKSIYK
jgi:hypothetical protein